MLNVGTIIGGFSQSTTIDLPIASVNWPCGSQVTVKNIYIQYDTNNNCGYDCSKTIPSKCKIFPGPFTVYPPLIANFSYQGSCSGAPITFTDTSSGGDGSIQSWSWNFGDGTTYPGQTPPPHTYANSGKYTVTLQITDIQNVLNNPQTITSTISHDITVYGPPTANFTATPASGCAPLPVTLTNTSNGNGRAITGWTWDFGDSTTYNGQTPPAHSYSSPGTYTVTLTAATACGSNSKTRYITVYGPPTANFTATPTSGCAPLPVTLTNTSNGNGRAITGWTWDFGDSYTYSGQTPPTHSYSNPGTYTVKLTVTTACGSNIKTRYITVYGPPTANFTATPASGCAPLPVTLTNTSNGNGRAITGWTWDFGDSTTYNGQTPPAHSYSSPGTYTGHTHCGYSMRIE